MLNALDDRSVRSAAFRLPRLVGLTAQYLLPAVAGLLLARTPMFGTLYPLGFSLLAAAPRGYVVSAAVGVLLGFIIPGTHTDILKCIAAALAVAGIRWALSEFRRVGSSPLFPAGAALAGVMLTGIVVSASSGADVGYEMLWCGAEGVLAAAGAYFFHGSFGVLRVELGRGDGTLRPPNGALTLSRQDVCCLVVSAAMVAIPLCRLNIAGFSPAMVPLMVLVLISARKYGVAGGAVAGIAFGAVTAIALEQYMLAGVCAAAGLAAALFTPVGTIISAAAFSITCSLGSLGTGAVNVFFLVEVLLASAIYPVLKGRWYEKLLEYREPDARPAAALASCDGLYERLNAAAEGLTGVSETVCEVAARLDKLDAVEPETVCRKAASGICGSCGIYSYCWNSARDGTVRAFSELSQVLQRDGALRRENTPEYIRQRCARWGELVEELNRQYADFTARERARIRVAQVRSVIAEQLGGVSELLNELAEKVREPDDLCPATATALCEELTGCGFRVLSARCTVNPHGQTLIGLELADEGEPLCGEDIAIIAGDLLGMEFAVQQHPAQDGIIRAQLTQTPPLAADFGAAQHRRGGEALCGDAYDAMELGGCAVFLMSDGMGSGGRAAVDAAMTCGLLGKLLRAGFGIRGALRVVNSAMLVRSDDESLATADCMRLNLFSGETVFTKSGAAQSFVRRGNEVQCVEVQSLPLGIMREADCGDCSLTLVEGDVAVLLSDGATGGDTEWICNELRTFDGEDTRMFARNLVSLASARCDDGADDDITVLVVAVRAA